MTPELIRTIVQDKAGWAIAPDDSHGSHDGLIGFAPVRFSELLAPGSMGGKHWVTPSGISTKGHKTRHNKRTDGMILRRRHAAK